MFFARRQIAESVPSHGPLKKKRRKREFSGPPARVFEANLNHAISSDRRNYEGCRHIEYVQDVLCWRDIVEQYTAISSSGKLNET